MPFAAELRQSLRTRHSQVTRELANGDDLERVLTRHLLAVEAMAEGELITSVLLLSSDGKRLFHGAAPRLPTSYCDAIDGAEIGPTAGSCGTAAYLGRPIYVSDIATDPLWAAYRDLAIPHGLRSCWSTPIRDPEGKVVGTFAIYRRRVGNPTADEIAAIDMITEHAAKAIMLAKSVQDIRPLRPALRLVGQSQSDELTAIPASRLSELAAKLQHKAAELESVSRAKDALSAEAVMTIRLSRKLAALLRQIDDAGTT